MARRIQVNSQKFKHKKTPNKIQDYEFKGFIFNKAEKDEWKNSSLL